MMTPVCGPQVSLAAMTVPTVATAMAGMRTDHCGRYLVSAYAAIGNAAETSDCTTTSATARTSIDSGQRRRNAMTAMITGIRTANSVGGHGMLASCSSRINSRIGRAAEQGGVDQNRPVGGPSGPPLLQGRRLDCHLPHCGTQRVTRCRPKVDNPIHFRLTRRPSSADAGGDRPAGGS